MSTNTERIPLDEVAEGRIDDKMFYAFLTAYGYYWHHCHAEGHFNDEVLHNAEENAIAYAKEHGLRLEFGEMGYKLEPSDEQYVMPTGTEKSCYAPQYSELSGIVKEAIDLISTMWPKEPEDVEGIAFWLKRNKRFLKGSQRVVKARQVLHEKYDHSLIEPERERDINELLWTYQHLFYHVAEKEYDAEGNISRFLIEIDLGQFLPPFDEHDMQEEEVIEYSHKILERMLDFGMLTEVGQDDTGKMSIYINEPENW